MIPLTVEHLTKRYGKVAAVDDVTLKIEPGEIFFLLGPSGCGKTTLLRSIAGFVFPDEGRILFGPLDVTGTPPHRRKTAMMFQSYALWPHMDVAGNVAFGLQERKIAASAIKKKVEDALERVQMGAFAKRKIHELSGGQQQRIALARAMVVRPDFLLLDEPLSNLDVRLRIELRAEIRRICKESGLTSIYVTHDQKEALSTADRLAIMRNGNICQTGKPEDLYRTPSSRFAAEFMGESNFLEGTILEVNLDGAIVQTTLGVFSAARQSGAGLRLGQACALSIRPECWTLSTQPAGRNCVKGRILDRTYLGETAENRFLAEGAELKIRELNPRPVESGASRTLYAHVEMNDVVVLTS